MEQVGFDTETDLIGPDNVIPNLVCLTMSHRGGGSPEQGSPLQSLGVSVADDSLGDVLDWLFAGDKKLIAQNTSFDLWVLCKYRPDLIHRVYDMAMAGLIEDTKITERLLMLSTHGNLNYEPMPDGSKKAIGKKGITLEYLEKKYLLRDRSAQKEGEDVWRLNYNKLAHLPFNQFPEDAQVYAIQDAEGALEVHEKQMGRIRPKGHSSANTRNIQVAADFSLLAMTAIGVKVNPERHYSYRAWVEEQVKPEKLPALVASGILMPATPARPRKGQIKTEWDTTTLTKEDLVGRIKAACEEAEIAYPTTSSGKISTAKGSLEKLATTLMSNGAVGAAGLQLLQHRKIVVPDEPVMVKPDGEHIAEGKLRELVKEACEEAGIEPKLSDKGGISLEGDWMDTIKHLSPIFEEYAFRKQYDKLRTTEFPRMCKKDENGEPTLEVADRVHAPFNVIVETLRTSSHATQLYPSMNGQNVDPRARDCFEADEGWLILATDYSGLELVAKAQKEYTLFGTSTLGDLINKGDDPHAFLGAQLAYQIDENFKRACHEAGAKNLHDVYEIFQSFKNHDSEELRNFYKHFRKLAKPTGLGYPGGLGPATFQGFARGYGVDVTIEEATLFREIWKSALPEAKQCFDWVTKQAIDPANEIIGEKTLEDGTVKPVKGYAYETWGGAYRAGCPFTAAANGAFLQTDAALGAKLAVISVVQACVDEQKKSPLYGCMPILFIHDEILTLVPIDDRIQERVEEHERLMVEAMKTIMTRVDVRVESTLCPRWRKDAEPVFDDEGNLKVWEPKEVAYEAR